MSGHAEAHGGADAGGNDLAKLKAAGKGFLMSRVNGFVGGGKDIVVGLAGLGKDTLGSADSKGSPGVLGVVKNIGTSVKETLVGDNRGILRLKGTKLNPFDGEGAVNPFRIGRRIAAGVTEVMAESYGGTIGLISAQVGNATRTVIKGYGRSMGGLFLGDFGHYMGGSKVDVGHGGGGHDAHAPAAGHDAHSAAPAGGHDAHAAPAHH